MFRFMLPAALLFLPLAANAADPGNLELTIKDHQFNPAELHAPANTPIVIHFTNADSTAEEFDSGDLKTEKVAAGGKMVMIRLPAMKPGTYKFKGEYHENTARGTLVVDAQ